MGSLIEERFLVVHLANHRALMQILNAAFWSRVKPLLDQALTLAPQDREPFLDQACTDDPALRAAVEQLLSELEHFDQSAFMESPIADRFEALLADALDPETRAEHPVEIGPYRTVRPLGHGGMGVVFLAERVDGQFERQVALKLIRQGAHSKAAALRFLHERQILARLQHPHIAQLHDAGVTDDGRPYFVMEYVQGQLITQYCDQYKLSIKERLVLFLQVCAALQYAHRNLVVHRDVKPSNILVTEEGQVKLLDFGIAKVLSGDGATAVTQLGMPALTPDYAAPEQVRGETITMVTDVYALGILLYELLSGYRPYRVQGALVEEWVQVICETEPAPPSLKVGTREVTSEEEPQSESLEQVSGVRATTPLRLQRQLSGDLDTIVLKALRKEPERRYGSVEALVGDIERYLGEMPILARRDTLGYRMGKFARRHRIRVGFAVLLVVMMSGFTWRTVVERNRAEVSAMQAEEVSDYLVDLFAMSDPFSTEEVRGDTTEVRVFLERGASQIEALSGQGEVQSMLKGVLGQVYQGLGEYEEAEGFFREALAQRRVLYGKRSVEVAESMHDLGGLLRLWSGKAEDDAAGNVYAEAEGLLREALTLRRQLLGEEHVEVAATLSDLGLVLYHQGQYAEAATMHREALTLRKKLLGEEHPEVAISLNNLGIVLIDQGNYAEAETIYRESLALFKKLLGEEHPNVAIAVNNLAGVLKQQGNYAEAETMFRETVALQKKLLGEEHSEVAISLNNLANTLYDQGKYAEAETIHRNVLASRKKLLGEEHLNVAISLINLANAVREQGNYDEAEPMHREALASFKKLLGEEHPYVTIALKDLAVTLRDQGTYAEAETMFREALALQKKLLGEEHPQVATTLRNWGALLVDQGGYAEAETLLLESFEIFKQTLGLDHPDTQRVIDAFLALYAVWDKPEQAARYRAMRTDG